MFQSGIIYVHKWVQKIFKEPKKRGRKMENKGKKSEFVMMEPPERKNLEDYTTDIRREIRCIAENFCRIGFMLWKVRQLDLYTEKGYKNVYEYAKRVLDLKRSTTCSYIGVCERFSRRDNGFPTGVLASDFCGFSFSQLVEMLGIGDEDLKSVTPSMTVKEIRRFKKEHKQAGQMEFSGSLSSCDFGGKQASPNPVNIWSGMLDDGNMEDVQVLLSSLKGKAVSVFTFKEA